MNEHPTLAERYRCLAEEARIDADRLTDPAARAAVLQIAHGYEDLAEIAERYGSRVEPDEALPSPA